MAKPKGNGGSLKLYTSYNFVDKDPVIDRTHRLVKREGMSYKEIHERSGVTVSTLRGWFEGKTKRPQWCTVMAVVHALGYRATFTKKGGA